MAGSYIQQLFADRIGGSDFANQPAMDQFESINKAKTAAIQAHSDLEWIEMGGEEPDEMADLHIVTKLAEEAAKPENRGSAGNGISEFRQAAADYLLHVFGVSGVDPDKEIHHVTGAKTGLALLPSCLINPGDVTIMTVPGYPVIGTHTKYAGGEVYHVPLTPERQFLPDLDAIPMEIRQRAKLFYLNYPNNPTGATATPAFFEQVVQFARDNHIVIVHDATYAALTFDETSPLSFLSVPGAKEVGVELHSLSSSYNMAGWRIGFIAGNELVVKAFATVRNQFDSGQFVAIQKAAAYALHRPEMTEKIVEQYSRRLDMLVEMLQTLGFKAEKPKASFFLYVEAPKGIRGGQRFETAEDCSQYLIHNRLISTVPCDDAGRYIRFSVTFPASDIDEEIDVINEIRQRLSDVPFEF